jgi:metal-dependent hydrolase (beta-lactamase superfamily II)
VLGYIAGNKYSLPIDAGNSAKHTKKFYEELKVNGFRLHDYTALMHWNWDHTFGMHAITGKSICGHLTNKKLIEVSKWKWTDEEAKLWYTFIQYYAKIFYGDGAHLKMRKC